MPTKREEQRCKNCKKIYCGNATKLPKKYYRFGSRADCLRSGIGLGLYVLPKNKSREKRKERKKKIKDNEVLSKDEIQDEYQDFMDKNFKKALRNVKRTDKGQIFRQLAILWNAKS